MIVGEGGGSWRRAILPNEGTYQLYVKKSVNPQLCLTDPDPSFIL